MDLTEENIDKGKERPHVPLETYKWEEVYRSRSKGGYPWTHLYKEPFDEELDPERYTMEALRRSKSPSTCDQRSEGVEIEEIYDEDDKSQTESFDKRHSDYLESPDDVKIFTIESAAEDSDNISQYLDKEDRFTDDSGPSKDNLSASSSQPEEKNRRKRKISGESSYSKISLSKLTALKNLGKQKIAKIKFPASKISKTKLKPKKSSPPQTKKEVAVKQTAFDKNAKPVYIHIPLKPPEGEDDEFSHLEFEEKRIINKENENEIDKKVEAPSFRTLVKAIKKDHDEKKAKEVLDIKLDDQEPKEMPVESTLMEDNSKLDLTLATDIGEVKSVQEEIKTTKEKPETVEDEIEDFVEETTHEVFKRVPRKSISEELKKEDYSSSMEVDTTEDEEEKVDFDKLFEAGSSKPKQIELPKVSVTNERNKRSKSAEPEQRKRKMSMESSYSRKSLSKLAFLKKIKEAKDKIKFPSFSNLLRKPSKKKTLKKEKEEQPKKEVQKVSKKKEDKVKPADVKPVYIHIPLKPPPGEKDEYSHLENGQKVPLKTQDSNDSEITISDAPDSEKAPGVQFIFLTAPSDDEILDDHSCDVPETPSSENKFFFPTRIVDLKKLAKDVVDEISPETRRRKLEPLSEEMLSEDAKIEEEYDKEDGLKITEHIKEEKVEEKKEIKPSIKGEGSPVFKKKVSFKRRSKVKKKDDDDSDDYEEISVPEEKKKEANTLEEKNKKEKVEESKKEEKAEKKIKKVDEEMVTEQEVKVVEEIVTGSDSYTDDIKMDIELPEIAISSEKDNKRWSKISDHEYEPVNPPPEEEEHAKKTIMETNIQEKPEKPDSQHITFNMETETFYSKDPSEEHTHEKNERTEKTTREMAEMSPPLHRSSFSSVDKLPTEENKDTPKTESKFQTTLKLKAGQFKTKAGEFKDKMQFKSRADQFKNKIQNMKKPNLHLPQRKKVDKPAIQKAKVEKTEKSKFKMPKIPDTTTINLPSFSLPRINISIKKTPLKERQESTESNFGDSKKPALFDFSTYPRMFNKKKEKHTITEEYIIPETQQKRSKSMERIVNIVRIPLHTEDSGDYPENNENIGQDSRFSNPDSNFSKSDTYTSEYSSDFPHGYRYKQDSFDTRNSDPSNGYQYKQDSFDTRTSDISQGYQYKQDSFDTRTSEFSLDPNDPSLVRYNQDIDIDDEYIRDNQELDEAHLSGRWQHGSFNPPKVTDLDSPSSIPQEEIFPVPRHSPRHSSRHSLELHRRGVLEEINSDEFFLRQKGISQDNMEIGKYLSSEIREAFNTPKNALSDMQGSEFHSNQSLPEVKPKKKPARKSKGKKTPDISNDHMNDHDVAQQEHFSTMPPTRPKRMNSRTKNLPYADDESYDDQRLHEIMQRYDSSSYDRPAYENEKTQEKDQPSVSGEDASRRYYEERMPEAPPRRQKSLKSLNLSEHDSIMGDFSARDYQMQGSIENVRDYPHDHQQYTERYSPYVSEENLQQFAKPVAPKRCKSKTSSRSMSQVDSISQGPSENQMPCVEEPCLKDLRDCMGYAIVDKSQNRDPPLPPPRTPPRRRRSIKSQDKFSTVPRSLNDAAPTRPVRNYSTLGQSRRKRSLTKKQEKEKENIDITQYIEVDDDVSRLQSGEVIQKMQNRPLPAPPRPPRKGRVLKDITSEENIISQLNDEEKQQMFEETDVSTQTEPLPDDFVCEEVTVDPSPQEEKRYEQHIITPTHYQYEETITHGSLIVEPINGAKILPDSQLQKSNERIVPVHIDSDETTEIPESFKKLKDPPEAHLYVEPKLAQKIQVSELDVDKLTVNELLASKIIVSEIDSEHIQTNDISSKKGVIKVGEIELPPQLIENLIKNIKQEEEKSEQKKTPIEQVEVESRVEYIGNNIELIKNIVEPSENFDEPIENVVEPIKNIFEPIEDIVDSSIPVVEEFFKEGSHSITATLEQTPPTNVEDSEQNPPTPPPRASEEAPQRPPRHSERSKTEQSDTAEERMIEPDIDDFLPPRPPQPSLGYLDSQPPASFYALRAQKFVDENIPAAAPRRRRHHQRLRSRSSSEESTDGARASRRHTRVEPSIGQLSGQLAQACGSAANNAMRRLIKHIKDNVLNNEDGKQDLHVVILILLVLIAGLMLLGYGDDKTVVHLHHWEYFNPPKDM